ncbi:hypothetical protein H0H93_014927 [Arthromyces matolae]|nr:hypothetical protein H0H93_014927 [Arthromyces matolae]
MQFKILFVLLFCCFTFGIPVANIETPEPPIDTKLTDTTNRLTRRVFSRILSHFRGDSNSRIQPAIDMCRNNQAHFLGEGDYGSAWRVDLPGVIQVVLKVIRVKEKEQERAVARELHNLERVEQLLEWGKIKKGGWTVCYILMPYMGMSRADLLKIHPDFDRTKYTTLRNKAREYYMRMHEMEHIDIENYRNVVFREETIDGKQEIVADLIDWGLAIDLYDRDNIPTSLDDERLTKWKRKIVDDKGGEFSTS